MILTHKKTAFGFCRGRFFVTLNVGFPSSDATYFSPRYELKKNHDYFYCIKPVKHPIIRSFKFLEIIMAYPMLTETVASISELKANPMKVVASGDGMPVAVLNRNQPAFYCVPALAYQAMMELIDDMALLEIVKQRQKEESIAVSLDDL
jgi:antitoxin StbD